LLSITKYHSWKMVSDPIYGYVYFNIEVEEPIINSILLQRLRYIMQLQTAHLVYPGAVHTRFQHSLGVMHLAGLMSEDLVSKIVGLYGKWALEGYEPHTLIEASRLAGLLHDVGHAAFSHAFERQILWGKNAPKEVSNHEKIGLLLVKHLLEEHLDKAEREYPGLKEVLYAILGDVEPRGVLRLFRWIVREGFYPADVIDFLRRDSYYSGTIEYGSILYERLYRNTYPFINGDRYQLVLDRIAIGEFKQYMYAKANMYEHVYYHSVCRSFDRILYEILDLLDEELGLLRRVLELQRGHLEGYLELTDAFMYGVMMGKALHDKSKLGYLCRRLLIERKPEWKRVGKEVVISPSKGLEGLDRTLRLIFDRTYRHKVEEEIKSFVADGLKSRGISEDEVWIDILDITPLPRSTIYPGGEQVSSPPTLLIGKKVEGKVVVSEELNLFVEELPLKVIVRAYVNRAKYTGDLEQRVTSLLLTAVGASLSLDLTAPVKLVERIYGEYAGLDFTKYKITS
jgi:HD superfamily phosphohydrolase